MQKSIQSSDYARLIAWLIAKRDAVGMSQQILAKKLDVHQSFVAKVETGQRRIDVVEFVTIAKALGVDPVRLFRDFVAGKAPPAAKRRKRSAV
jgi:transcriptional regulator with XRE-family HTH domain